MIFLSSHSTGSHRRFEPIPAPYAMVEWCRRQPLPMALYEDAATVDLDWWNLKLWEHSVPVTLLGRGPDGEIVDTGIAEISRLDIFTHARFKGDVDDSPFVWAQGPEAMERARSAERSNDAGHLLTLLYLCAAWSSGHPHRRNRRVFHRYSEDSGEGLFAEVPSALAASASFIEDRDLAFAVLQHPDTWLGRLEDGQSVPGLGPVVATHFLAALSVARRAPRVVPVEPAAINMLIRCGWHEFDASESLTTRNFSVFQETIHDWAKEARTAPELVEMWLVKSWHELGSLDRRGVRD